MNVIKKHSPLLLLLVALSLPWTSLQALETFQHAGIIASTGVGTFTVDSQKYTLTPTVSVKTQNKENGKASNLKSGDNIFIKGRILNSVYYVDYIAYIPIGNK